MMMEMNSIPIILNKNKTFLKCWNCRKHNKPIVMLIDGMRNKWLKSKAG